MRKANRRARKARSTGGRPRKSLKHLRASGGYSRNPGRFLKRHGIVPQQPDPAPEAKAAWDRLFAHLNHQGRENAAYHEACDLDLLGRYSDADQVLRKASVSSDAVIQRRKHIDWRLSQGMAAV